MQNEKDSSPATQGMDGKTVAFISYFTIIGWVIAFVINNNNKSQIATYHLRQSLFIMLAVFLLYIAETMLSFIPYVDSLVSLLLAPVGLFLLVLWFFGLIFAITGEEKPIPIVGETAQQLFSSIK